MCSAVTCQGMRNAEYTSGEPRHSQARKKRIGRLKRIRAQQGEERPRRGYARRRGREAETGGGKKNIPRGTRAVPWLVGRLDREGGAGAERAPWTRENVQQRRGHGASACQKGKGAQTGYHSGAGGDWLGGTNVQGTGAAWDECSRPSPLRKFITPRNTACRPARTCLKEMPPRTPSSSPVLQPPCSPRTLRP